MKNKFLKYAFLGCSLMLIFSACRKDPFSGTETKQSGTTFVYITEAGGSPYYQFFDVFSDVKPVVLFTVRRDASSNSDLQKAVTVTLTAQPDSTDNLGLTPFTSDLYTTPSAADLAAGGLYSSSKGVTVSGDGSVITLNFAAGEFIKNIIFKVDGSKLDLSNTYGSVYKITSMSAFKQKASLGTVAAGVAVKNAYDGTYALTGTVFRFVAGGAPEDNSNGLSGSITAGVTSTVITKGPVSNNFNIAWANGGGVGGIDGLYFTVDPATNKVTVASTGNPNLHNIDGMDNFYDPATKTFTLNFAWFGGAPPPVGSSRQAHVQLAYSGPR
ncbi:hypothetical protein [Mucilaginibacter sp.]|uniref:hypothetical protein n=1 Tax=Mucilaginibacter sp. TaxID=1882438 RepID=UPI0025E8908D|nr:hypothetical protein [Mucilaginibacter sp.]